MRFVDEDEDVAYTPSNNGGNTNMGNNSPTPNNNENKSWMSSVIDSVVGGFTKMLSSIKKHGMVFSMFTMFIFVLLWSFIINPIHFNEMIEAQWKKYIDGQNNVKKEMIERRIQANDIVGDIMSKLLFKFHCNRVLLLEKHNSVQSLGNVDFLYLSCTLEMIDIHNQDIDYISEDLQRQMTVNLLGSDVTGLLKHSKYLFYDNLQTYNKSQCRLLNKLKAEGEKQCIIYPFCDASHKPLLILVICGENLDVKEIIDYIDGFKSQITNLLIFEE